MQFGDFFLSELDNYMETTGIKNEVLGTGERITGISDRAYRIDLQKATDMSDVFINHFLVTS